MTIQIPTQSSSQREIKMKSDRNVNTALVSSHTNAVLSHTHTRTAGYSTSSDGSNEGLDGDSPGVVPGPDDKHHSQRLWLDVDGVREGQQVLLHRLRGCPLLQLPDGQVELPLQTQSLVQLGSHLALGRHTMTLDLLMLYLT